MTTYPFTEQEMDAASREWGCNCGPSALAFALQKPLGYVRHAIPGFDEKRYTSPSMMAAALKSLGVDYFRVREPEQGEICRNSMALVRVQWTGPWTAPGANPKWAYRQTHWIASYRPHWIFDCNGGIQHFAFWREKIVPAILEHYPRADGGWFPTHIWRLT